MLEWLLLSLAAATVAALVAGSKKRSAAGWFFAVFALPFLLLAVLFMAPAEPRPAQPLVAERRCPRCKSALVPDGARYCPDCGAQNVE